MSQEPEVSMAGRRLEDQVLSRTNEWFSLAKNAVWVIGLVILGMYKFAQQENKNEQQDAQIKHIIEERTTINDKLEKVDKNVTAVLIMATELKVQRETEQRMRAENGTSRSK